MRQPRKSHRRRPASGRTDGVSIASGAHIPWIDLDALFRPASGKTNGVDSASGAGQIQAPCVAMTGGAQAAPAPPSGPQASHPIAVANTISLTDGTRITFAVARDVTVFESA